MVKNACWHGLGVVAFCVLLSGCQVNPVTGQKQLRLVSTSQEIQMGHSYHPDIIFMYDGEYLDPDLKRYLGSIVVRLHKVSHRSDMPVDFTVLNTSVINAFAIPGHVYATRGFLGELKNEAQFAAVMGHELGHVAYGHSAQQMTRQQITSLGMGVLQTALKDNSTASTAIMTGSQLSVTLLGLSYSRQQEHQADRVGTYYMALAGWDPRESVSMQRLLGSFSQSKPSFLDKYLSTHPPMNERIKDIEEVIRDKALLTSGLIQGDGIYAERWQRHLARLRQDAPAFAQYDQGMKHFQDKHYDQALQAADQAIQLDPSRAPFYRLKGDALVNLQRYDQARQAYQTALQQDPRYVPANTGLGDIALQGQHYAQAQNQYGIAVYGYPGSLRAHYGLGVSLFKQNKYQDAIAPLTQVAQAEPSLASVQYMLGAAYDHTQQWQAAFDCYQRALQAGLEPAQAVTVQQRVAQLQKILSPGQGSSSTTGTTN